MEITQIKPSSMKFPLITIRTTMVSSMRGREIIAVRIVVLTNFVERVAKNNLQPYFSDIIYFLGSKKKFIPTFISSAILLFTKLGMSMEYSLAFTIKLEVASIFPSFKDK